MESFKNVIKRIKELIDSFTKPAEAEKNLDELAAEANIGEADLNALKKSMDGVKWTFNEENEEIKKERKTRIEPKQVKTQPIPKKVETEKDLGIDR